MVKVKAKKLKSKKLKNKKTKDKKMKTKTITLPKKNTKTKIDAKSGKASGNLIKTNPVALNNSSARPQRNIEIKIDPKTGKASGNLFLSQYFFEDEQMNYLKLPG